MRQGSVDPLAGLLVGYRIRGTHLRQQFLSKDELSIQRQMRQFCMALAKTGAKVMPTACHLEAQT